MLDKQDYILEVFGTPKKEPIGSNWLYLLSYPDIPSISYSVIVDQRAKRSPQRLFRRSLTDKLRLQYEQLS